MIKAAVFDLDHTLFDRYGTIRKIAPDIVASFDVAVGITSDIFAEELIFADKQFVHKGWRNIHAYLVEKNIFNKLKFCSEFLGITEKKFGNST